MIMFSDSPRGVPGFNVDNNPVAADEEVTFTCIDNGITALPTVYQYTFYKDASSEVNETSSVWKKTFQSVKSSSSYSCKISNLVGSSAASAEQYLSVLGNIRYISTVQNINFTNVRAI